MILGPVREAEAEALALTALGWIVADPDLARAFLTAAGADPGDLHARAADSEFLGFVLDFLLADEARLLAFAYANGINPGSPMRARAALPGGDLPNWT